MLNNKTIAVVVPAYNEEKQIGQVIETIPDFVDRIIIVNDCSTDKTEEIVNYYLDNDNTKTIIIPNILNDVKQNRYNQADHIVQERMKEEISWFVSSQVVTQNPEKKRIILISHLKNAGVGSAIARGYKWCKDYGIDCTAVMAGDAQMDPAELESICRPIVEDGIDCFGPNYPSTK